MSAVSAFIESPVVAFNFSKNAYRSRVTADPPTLSAGRSRTPSVPKLQQPPRIFRPNDLHAAIPSSFGALIHNGANIQGDSQTLSHHHLRFAAWRGKDERAVCPS